jgi:hypothetical protein
MRFKLELGVLSIAFLAFQLAAFKFRQLLRTARILNQETYLLREAIRIADESVPKTGESSTRTEPPAPAQSIP